MSDISVPQISGVKDEGRSLAIGVKSPGRERCRKGAVRHQVRTEEGEHK